jgi:hypothetical protein
VAKKHKRSGVAWKNAGHNLPNGQQDKN